MMKMRIVLFLGMLALVCLSVKAEDPKAEPEAAAEPEPAAEPESTHDGHDAKHSGSSKSETKAAKNPAAAPWAFNVPAILALTAVAKFVL